MNDQERLAARVQNAALFDIYGALLTRRQREAYVLHELEDLSLGEIAEELGVSRQGAHDLVHRAREHLLRMEEAVGAGAMERSLEEAESLMAAYAGSLPGEFVRRMDAVLERRDKWSGRDV
ncbi:MAG: DNA-binding protein [Synergistales bacterium]|nr:DNA-binding protein [Synergistales bacterium]